MGPLPRVPHPPSTVSCQDHTPLHQMERISHVRNRMRELRSSGSVGGEAGNLLAYPAVSGAADRVSAKPRTSWMFLSPRTLSADNATWWGHLLADGAHVPIIIAAAQRSVTTHPS